MKKLFLVCLMMLAGSAWAEWVMFGESEEAHSFYDPTTIRKEGNMRRVWQLSNLKRRGVDGEMSRRLRAEYDCKQERYQLLDVSEHSEPMVGGKVLISEIGNGTWSGVAPETIAAYMFEIVCAN